MSLALCSPSQDINTTLYCKYTENIIKLKQVRHTHYLSGSRPVTIETQQQNLAIPHPQGCEMAQCASISFLCIARATLGLKLDRVNFLPRSCYNRLWDKLLQSLVSGICPVYFDTSGRFLGSLQYQ